MKMLQDVLSELQHLSADAIEKENLPPLAVAIDRVHDAVAPEEQVINKTADRGERFVITQRIHAAVSDVTREYGYVAALVSEAFEARLETALEHVYAVLGRHH